MDRIAVSGTVDAGSIPAWSATYKDLLKCTNKSSAGKQRPPAELISEGLFSGEVASKVANKIYEISLGSQVITITHLPQVACLSKNHVKISKFSAKGRTFTQIKELNLDEKIYEIASLISGGKVSEKQLEYAKEMVMNR